MGLIYNWKENIGNVKKTGIPASRLAMALGISKWGSPLDLWLERKGLLEDDFKDTINMQWGRALEDDIIERYQSLHPEYVVEKYIGKLLSDEVSKIHGYPDALIYENGKLIGVLECKTGSIHQRKFWDTGIPIDYEAQGHGYLILVPEAMFCDFAFFYSTGDDIIEKRLNRDDTILAEISKRAAGRSSLKCTHPAKNTANLILTERALFWNMRTLQKRLKGLRNRRELLKSSL